MRTTILLFSFFLLSVNCHAEGAAKLAFSPSDSITLNAQVPTGTGTVIVSQYVKNISGGDIIVKWNVANYTGQTGWDYKVCTPDSCFDFPPPASFPEVSLANGDSILLEWEVIPNTLKGAGFCTCNFWVKGDSAQSNLRNFLRVNLAEFLSVPAWNASNNLKLFPNPSASVINIDTEVDADEITVSNMQGQVVISNGLSKQIDVAALPKGLYVLQILQKGKQLGVAYFQR